ADAQLARTGGDPGRFAGRVVAVIGAGRGIGAGIAQRVRSEGATLVVGDRDLELAEGVVRRVGRTGSVLAFECDLGTAGGAQAIVDRTLERFGRLDVIVQNAAIYPWTLIGDISIEEWDSVLGV